MKVFSNIKDKISIPFIVASVCLFNVNTSIALQRPYIPATGKWPGVNGPLSSIVAKVQSEQKEDNTVIWVDYNSPYFSNAGLAPSGSAMTTTTTVFHGFQDVDQSTDSFNSFEPIKLPTKAKKKTSSTINHAKQEETQANQQHSEPAVVIPSINNGTRVFRAIDEPVLMEQEQDLGQIAQVPINVWSDLDS